MFGVFGPFGSLAVRGVALGCSRSKEGNSDNKHQQCKELDTGYREPAEIGISRLAQFLEQSVLWISIRIRH